MITIHSRSLSPSFTLVLVAVAVVVVVVVVVVASVWMPSVAMTARVEADRLVQRWKARMPNVSMVASEAKSFSVAA